MYIKNKLNIKKIAIEDKKYPEQLKNIPHPPKQLYVLGNEELLSKKSIAIIGSRVCSEKGAKIANKFSEEISKRGIVVVSGMAKGIDSAAHLGALNQIGKTIAVLGAGFNNIFPKENEQLFYNIINSGGTIISEYEENKKVTSQGFIERNRIVSGLSHGVLVVEAKIRSGTSITAEFAKRQGKKVFCIAHGIEEKEGVGTNRLIKKGAKLVTDIEDIFKELGIPVNNVENVNTKVKKNKEIVNIPEEYIQIYSCFGEKPISIDEMLRKTKITINNLNYTLTMMELEGYIEKLPGNLFKIK